MLRFGFELEGFRLDEEGDIIPPTEEYPLDGFPGLVELRTQGGASIEEAFGNLIVQAFKLPKFDVNFKRSQHKFSAKHMQWMRKHLLFYKDPYLDIRSIYNKPVKRTGNLTLASFQINISNQLEAAYTDKNGNIVPAKYGLLDISSIVRNLDKEFEFDIRNAVRQPGLYAIKNGTRLEYRSLPNNAFDFDHMAIATLIWRINRAVKV